jgi:hypothetical protein
MATSKTSTFSKRFLNIRFLFLFLALLAFVSTVFFADRLSSDGSHLPVEEQALCCIPIELAAKAETQPTLDSFGVGPLRFGMSFAEASDLAAASGATVKMEGEAIDQCRYVSFSHLPGFLFVIDENVVVRADLSDPRTFPPNSLRTFFGESVAAFAQRFHGTSPAKQHVIVKSNPDEAEGMGSVFSFSSPFGKGKTVLSAYSYDGKVSSLRAGFTSHVFLKEGCV